jgi:hypothetical protein
MEGSYREHCNKDEGEMAPSCKQSFTRRTDARKNFGEGAGYNETVRVIGSTADV